VKVKEGILVHASKILDPEFQVVNQNKSKVVMPASFLNNQSAGTVKVFTCVGIYVALRRTITFACIACMILYSVVGVCKCE
jgi:hypothetical protein